MNPVAALTLYPLWAVATAVGVIALRLGGQVSAGLVAACFTLALWVTGLILFEHPGTSQLAERVLPSGMLVAGGFVHAGIDLMSTASRWPI
ncbi:MAG: hypothetical protein MJE77_43275 [Proteobacteria bacterium]|nr:hypothetical protein [Pseudomonadota bacterium]